MATHVVSMRVADASQVGAVRRAVGTLAEQARLDESDRGRAALVATEIATNLARHARDGFVSLRLVATTRGLGVEILSLDRGPGMDVERCLRDGYTTGMSPGTGLGAIRRAATEFDVHSTEGRGTVLAVRVFARGRAPRTTAELTWGIVATPHPGEEVCGDAWAVVETDAAVTFLLADGLGHGPLASDAAERAVEVLHEAPDGGPARVLALAHERLRGSRGAAVAVGTIARTTGTLRYAGIGNVVTRIVTAGSSRSLVSLNGTVGVQMPAPKEFEHALAPGALVVAHSDGLSHRWDLGAQPPLAARDTAVIAGALYRDHARGNDDATVLVGRMLGAPRAEAERR